ncbi:MAG TPA: hypothetical protein VFZ49_02800 [Pyrinomonadaceae bacterium]
MILAIIFAVLAYQKAKASGRNAWLWVVIALALYIGVQLAAGIGIGIVLGIGVAVLEWPESVFTDYELPINIVAIILAIFVSWLMLKYLDRIPDEQPMMPPPPPPTFSEPEAVVSPADRTD